MADYTSNATGDWQGGAATTWNAGGSYPGDTGAQADTATIANGHTVDIDMAALDGTVAITVQNGGTLRVSATMTDNACFTALTIDSGGLLTFESGADRTLLMGGHVTVNGTITQDSSGGSDVYTISIHCTSSLEYFLTVNSGGTYTIKGASVTTIATLLAGGVSSGSNVECSFDATTDWAVGDEVLFVETPTNEERATLEASGNGGDYAVDLSNNYSDNIRVYHISRTAVLKENSGSYPTMLRVNSGGTLDADYAQFDGVLMQIKSNTNTEPLVGCFTTSTYDETLWVDANSLEIADTIVYTAGIVAHNREEWINRSLFTRCYFISTGDVVYQAGYASPAEFVACELCAGSGAYIFSIDSGAAGARLKAVDCYAWGGADLVGIRRASLIATACVFGEDPGGNTSQLSSLYRLTGLLDDCAINVSGSVIHDTHNYADWESLISTQHNQVSGARMEYQRFGTDEQVSDASFTDTVADEIDPSDDAEYHIKRLAFECDSGKTPTLTFYAEEEEEEESGHGIDTVQVELGDRRCGLTGIATGGTLTPGSYAQHTVTFTGTSGQKGVVEVILKIRDDDATGGGVLRVGDLAVSDNT